jgi:hypothetical protein
MTTTEIQVDWVKKRSEALARLAAAAVVQEALPRLVAAQAVLTCEMTQSMTRP